MGHVGSKTRSLSQLVEKPCILSRRYSFYSVFMKLCHDFLILGVVGWCEGAGRPLLTWITVGQGPIVLAVGAGGGCLDIFFFLIYRFSFLSPSLWETATYRLKYCLKGPLSPNQPTF